ncbi:uncharacterized protein LOC121976300 [Zingiber officinale]|uniref:uncharacterized protein LOC121976300 n=1 Tax=Zingiber officinale TaxID=94328 RepID=UPI001C4AA492|nr:uncharacterized protein LOC121976300 [Zingiber officinale]
MADGAGACNPGSGGGCGGDPEQDALERTRKAKSCKGCLYYSSILKSGTRNPVCVGISRTLPKVPVHVIGESEVKSRKDGHDLSDFKYTCVGYSIFLERNDETADKQENKAQLPFCAGIELLVEKRASTPDHVPARAHKEDATTRLPSQSHYPSHSPADELLNRFKRNAGLVASGVVKNLNKVGDYIKENIDDILYPYRRRPK